MSAQDRWVVRFNERKAFVEELKGKIIQHYNESREPALSEYLRMSRVCMDFIESSERLRLGAIDVDCIHRAYFQEHVLGEIQKFAETDAEVLSLVAEIHLWSGGLIARQVGGAYFDRREHP